MHEPETEQPLIYTGSMQLRDGPIHLIVDANLQTYYGTYHAQTSTVIYGTEIVLSDLATLNIGERSIELDAHDRAEMISLICEQSDAWLTLRSNDEIHEMLLKLSANPKYLNPGATFPPLPAVRQVSARDDVVQPEVHEPERPASIFSFSSGTPAAEAVPAVLGREGLRRGDQGPLPAQAPSIQDARNRSAEPSPDVQIGRFDLPERPVTQAQLSDTASSPPVELPEQTAVPASGWNQPDSAPAFHASSSGDTRRKMMPAEAAQAAKAAQQIKQQLQNVTPRAEIPRSVPVENARPEGLFAQIRRRFTGR